MTKRKKKQTVNAISMGDYSRAVSQRRDRKEQSKARKTASSVTVYKPDDEGNMVAVEQVEVPPLPSASRGRNLKRIRSSL
ncbi:hypothetical protein [Burkholderia gladioli]|uniref:hypothetical protein n=1 Tax=Burkholderia gladioli TaxID=28095 RepID=UPI00163EAF85|nr:hypothetical protein [Burkholderia gladioli]